jgi:hypothetical protein
VFAALLLKWEGRKEERKVAKEGNEGRKGKERKGREGREGRKGPLRIEGIRTIVFMTDCAEGMDREGG